MNPPSSRSAFTIPEVVITSVLIVLLMLPISHLSFSTTRNTRFARDVGTALSLAQARMERFADEPYASVTAGSEQQNGFLLSWTVQEQSFTKIVRLQVSWTLNNRPVSIGLNSAFTSNFAAGFSFE